MAYTTVPEYWESYMLSSMSVLNQMYLQGVLAIAPDASIGKGDNRWRKPLVTALRDVLSTDTQKTTSSTLTTEALADYSEYAPVIHRYQGVKIHDNQIAEKGMNHWDLLKNQVPDMVFAKIQTMYKNVLDGLFATSGVLNTSHRVDYSAGTATPIQLYQAAQSILGEGAIECKNVLMHSKVYLDLQENIDTKITALENGATLTERWLGDKRILINDTLCAATSSVYPTYIFAGTPFVLGWQKQMMMEEERSPKTGYTEYIWSYDVATGFNGVTYSSATDNPTNAQLATVGNWTSTTPAVSALKFVRMETL